MCVLLEGDLGVVLCMYCQFSVLILDLYSQYILGDLYYNIFFSYEITFFFFGPKAKP